MQDSLACYLDEFARVVSSPSAQATQGKCRPNKKGESPEFVDRIEDLIDRVASNRLAYWQIDLLADLLEQVSVFGLIYRC